MSYFVVRESIYNSRHTTILLGAGELVEVTGDALLARRLLLEMQTRHDGGTRLEGLYRDGMVLLTESQMGCLSPLTADEAANVRRLLDGMPTITLQEWERLQKLAAKDGAG